MEENGSATMLAAMRSAGDAPEVNLKECVTHTPPPSANKAAHSGFETQRRHHQKSIRGISVAPQKGLVSSKNLFKKKYWTERGRASLAPPWIRSCLTREVSLLVIGRSYASPGSRYKCYQVTYFKR